MNGNSYAELLMEWELLLKAVAADEADLAGTAPFRAALERNFALAVDAQRRRNALLTAAREATRQMHQAFRAYSEAVISLRCFLLDALTLVNEEDST